MKRDVITDALSELDDSLLEETDAVLRESLGQRTAHAGRWKYWAALAACLTLLTAALWPILRYKPAPLTAASGKSVTLADGDVPFACIGDDVVAVRYDAEHTGNLYVLYTPTSVEEIATVGEGWDTFGRSICMDNGRLYQEIHAASGAWAIYEIDPLNKSVKPIVQLDLEQHFVNMCRLNERELLYVVREGGSYAQPVTFMRYNTETGSTEAWSFPTIETMQTQGANVEDIQASGNRLYVLMIQNTVAFNATLEVFDLTDFSHLESRSLPDFIIHALNPLSSSIAIDEMYVTGDAAVYTMLDYYMSETDSRVGGPSYLCYGNEMLQLDTFSSEGSVYHHLLTPTHSDATHLYFTETDIEAISALLVFDVASGQAGRVAFDGLTVKNALMTGTGGVVAVCTDSEKQSLVWFAEETILKNQTSVELKKEHITNGTLTFTKMASSPSVRTTNNTAAIREIQSILDKAAQKKLGQTEAKGWQYKVDITWEGEKTKTYTLRESILSIDGVDYQASDTLADQLEILYDELGAPEDTESAFDDATKAQYNEEITDWLRHSIAKLVDFDQAEPINYLATPKGRHIFAWEIALQDQNIPTIWEDTLTGEGVTGALSMAEADYAAKYKALFDEEVDWDVLLSTFPDAAYFGRKDGRLYGPVVTGWGAPDFLLKVTDFVYNEQEGCHDLSVDLLTIYTNAISGNGNVYHQVDWDALSQYAGASVLGYPDNVIHAKLTIGVEQSGDAYRIHYLQYEPVKKISKTPAAVQQVLCDYFVAYAEDAMVVDSSPLLSTSDETTYTKYENCRQKGQSLYPYLVGVRLTLSKEKADLYNGLNYLYVVMEQVGDEWRVQDASQAAPVLSVARQGDSTWFGEYEAAMRQKYGQDWVMPSARPLEPWEGRCLDSDQYGVYTSNFYSVPLTFADGGYVTKQAVEDWINQFVTARKGGTRRAGCTLYHFLKEMHIPKEIALAMLCPEHDDNVYVTREQIEAIYSDDAALINQTCKNDNALYHDGRLYSMGWLAEAGVAAYRLAGITAEELSAYIANGAAERYKEELTARLNAFAIAAPTADELALAAAQMNNRLAELDKWEASYVEFIMPDRYEFASCSADLELMTRFVELLKRMKLTALPLTVRDGSKPGYMLNVQLGDNLFSFGSGFTDGYIYLGGELSNKVMFRIDNFDELKGELAALEQIMEYTR